MTTWNEDLDIQQEAEFDLYICQEEPEELFIKLSYELDLEL